MKVRGEINHRPGISQHSSQSSLFALKELTVTLVPAIPSVAGGVGSAHLGGAVPTAFYLSVLRLICYRPGMRLLILVRLFLLVTALGPAAWAGQGKVIKVLPEYLDSQGRNSLSPSLYERDAYQAALRQQPKLRAALCFAVQWRAKKVDWAKVKLRIEMRGAFGNSLRAQTLEGPARKSGWWSNWSKLKLEGEAFRQLGELQAWRATLWEGDQLLAEQCSFLW